MGEVSTAEEACTRRAPQVFQLFPFFLIFFFPFFISNLILNNAKGPKMPVRDKARDYYFILLFLSVGANEPQASSEEHQASPPATQPAQLPNAALDANTDYAGVPSVFKTARRKEFKTKKQKLRQRQWAKDHEARGSALRCQDQPENLKGQCCLDDFVIDFQELGLSSVLAPPSINIKRCRGVCRHGNYGSTNAVLRARALTIRALRAGAGPDTPSDSHCCAPFSFSDMSILTTDEIGRIYTNKLNFAVIESCAC